MSTNAPVTCAFCSAPAPRVYSLPPRVSQAVAQHRPACYFCYIRMAGIKPTRSRLFVAGDGGATAGLP